jgi:hypothetical protein
LDETFNGSEAIPVGPLGINQLFGLNHRNAGRMKDKGQIMKQEITAPSPGRIPIFGRSATASTVIVIAT